MLNWKPEYIALLSRYYRVFILKKASEEGYHEANRMIGRAAHARPLTVERWITGERSPNPTQGERLLRWAATVEWWEAAGGRWVRVSLASKLHELIRDSKKGG